MFVMENCRIDEFGQVNSILNSFSTDMFDGVTFIVRPVVGAIDYLRSMHQSYLFQKEIDKISNFDFETREKFMDILTDLVVDRLYDDEFINELEQKIADFNEISEIFKELSHRKLNIEQKQMHRVFKLSLRKLNGRIVSIRDEINSSMWDDSEDVAQLLLLDQLFYLIQEIINEALDLPPNKQKEINDLSHLLAYSLLYIEAFHRSKVSYDDLQSFLSRLSLCNYMLNKNLEDNDAIFETLVV